MSVARVSEAFGVSAMPVREALTRLLAVGVLANVSGRSVGVPNLSIEELVDLRHVRLQVEATAVSWAVQNRDASFLAELEDTLSKMVKAELSGDVRNFVKSNYDFHFRLYEQSRSAVLIDIINTLWLCELALISITFMKTARIVIEYLKSIIKPWLRRCCGAMSRGQRRR